MSRDASTRCRPYFEGKKSAAIDISRPMRQSALQRIREMVSHWHARTAKVIEPNPKMLSRSAAQVVKYCLRFFLGSGVSNHDLKSVAATFARQALDQRIGVGNRGTLSRHHHRNMSGR